MKAKKKSIIAAALSFSLIAGSFTAMAETQDVNIFTTDFESYQIGDAESVTAAFTSLPYATNSVVAAYGSTNAASIAGVTKDAEHGTSMELNDWWQTVDINLPTPCEAGDKALVSFDVLATDVTNTGLLKILGNNGNNFEGMFQVKWDGSRVDYVADIDSVIKEQVMPVGEWSNVAFYIDHENNKCVTYINAEPVCVSDLLGEKTPLSSVHFQTTQLGCKMYIDNIEVKKVSSPPYMKDLNASLKSESVNAQSDSITINFDGTINKDSVTYDSVKIYDKTNGQYLNFEFNDIGSTYVTIIFNGALKNNCEYTVELGSLTDIFGHTVKNNTLSFNTNTGDKQIYFTDFDSYTINGTVTEQTFTGFSSGSYGILFAPANGDGISGEVLDSEHGTSLKFSTGDWRNLEMGFSKSYNGKMLISVDFYMSELGTIRMMGNNGNNFGMSLAGTSYIGTTNFNAAAEKEGAIALKNWYRIETFVDTANDMQITYINGIQVGSVRTLEGNKTPLESFQIQKISGGEMYVDNVEVKEVSSPPYMKDLNASLKSESVNAQSDSITINFDGTINKDSVTYDSVKIYDETNGQYLDFTFNEIGSTYVTIVFNGALKNNCEYTIELGSLTDIFGQNVKNKILSFNTNAAEVSDRTPIISCDFDSYRLGTGSVVNKPFVDLSSPYLDDVLRPASNGDAIVGEVIDENYGISMKMSEGEWRSIDMLLPEKLEDEFILSFDFRMTDLGTFRVLTNNGLGAQACIDGTSGKPESNNESTVEYITNVIKLKEWATVELYVNPKQQSFAFYINGKMIGDEHEFYGETSQIESIQFQKISGGDMYVDNLSIEGVTGPPHTNPVQLSLSLENNIMPEGENSLYLQFSDIMDTSKINSGTINVSEVIGGVSTDVPFTLSEITSRRVKITLSQELKKEASYVITLDNNVTGGAGNSLAVNYIKFFPYSEELRVNDVEFTNYNGSISDSDEIPPEITSCTIYFNAPLTDFNIDEDVRFTDKNNAAVPARIRYIDSKNAVKITPAQMLKGNSAYNLYISENVLNTAYEKTFVTLDGSFAKGNISVNDGESKVTGAFNPGETVTVKADIINTECTAQDYVVMIGEYLNGKLSAYHFYSESTDADITFCQKEYNVTLLSQADEIRAFVWKNPRTAQTLREAR